jgi:hypothetical protein
MFTNIILILTLLLPQKSECFLISEKKNKEDLTNSGFFVSEKIKILSPNLNKKLILINGYEYKIIVYNSNDEIAILKLNDVWVKNILYVIPNHDSVETLEIQNINCGILLILFKKNNI